jgi:hypothetical protein
MKQNGNYLSELWDTANSENSLINARCRGRSFSSEDMFHDSTLPFTTYDTGYPGLRQDVGIYRPEQRPQGSERLIVNRLMYLEKDIEEAERLEAATIEEIERNHKEGHVPSFNNRELRIIEAARTVKPIRSLFYFLSGPEEGFLAYAIDLNKDDLSDFRNRISQPIGRRLMRALAGETTCTNYFIHLLGDFYKRRLISKDEARELKALLEKDISDWLHVLASMD